MTAINKALPIADSQTGLQVLKGLAHDRSLLTALRLMNTYVGDAFQITLPRFQPAVFCGPESNRQILVTQRHLLNWRSETDPVTKILQRGILVVDGEEHDHIRRILEPSLQRRHVLTQVTDMWHCTDQVTSGWKDGQVLDMLVEMRKIALLILMRTVFGVDFSKDMSRLWKTIIHLLEYISPGLWIFWPDMPRPKYKHSIREMDAYLYRIIAERKDEIDKSGNFRNHQDLLTELVDSPGMTDDLIRDQLLTLFIAGHDTSTSSLSWSLYLLGKYPDALAHAVAEVDEIFENTHFPPNIDQLNQLHFLDQVFKEALRLYPPIHVGNRIAVENMSIRGYTIPAGSRVMCSIYLSHHDPGHWEDADAFNPARFDRDAGEKVPPLTYIPFGGGPRNCIGAAFAQVEAKVVLSKLLSQFRFKLLNANQIKPYMGATLEPRPGVRMQIWRRENVHVS